MDVISCAQLRQTPEGKRLLQMRERTYAGHCNKRHAREIMHDIGLEGAFDQQYGILGVTSDVGPCLRFAAIRHFRSGQPPEFPAGHVIKADFYSLDAAKIVSHRQ